MDVEVDIFSGRPNPRFMLSPVLGDELLRRIEALRPVSEGDHPQDGPSLGGLGYRGLRVHPGAADADDPPVRTGVGPGEVVLAAGVVTVTGAAGKPGTRRFRDPGREVERWLFSSGASDLEPGVVAMVHAQLSGH